MAESPNESPLMPLLLVLVLPSSLPPGHVSPLTKARTVIPRKAFPPGIIRKPSSFKTDICEFLGRAMKSWPTANSSLPEMSNSSTSIPEALTVAIIAPEMRGPVGREEKGGLGENAGALECLPCHCPSPSLSSNHVVYSILLCLILCHLSLTIYGLSRSISDEQRHQGIEGRGLGRKHQPVFKQARGHPDKAGLGEGAWYW